MKREKLPEAEVQERLQNLNQGSGGWAILNDKLHKTFTFPDFIRAFGFMTQVAMVAQAMDHHPEWSNVYKKVVVDLSTHDAGGITSLDFELAAKMDTYAQG